MRSLLKRTRFAHSSTPLRGDPALRADGLKPFRGAYNLRAVNVLMTRPAERHAVIHVIPEIGIIAPHLNVMGLQIIIVAALLTGVMIASEYGYTPLAIFRMAALLLGIVLAFRRITAFLRAVFHSAPATLPELVSAPSADVRWNDVLFTDLGTAVVTMPLHRVADVEIAPAGLTSSNDVVSGRHGGYRAPVNMNFARLIVGANKAVTSWVWALLHLVRHSSIVPHFPLKWASIKRLSLMGLTPEREAADG